jgi:hypothetical protein
MTEGVDVKSVDFVKKWLGQIDYALKREKKFRTAGKETVKLYEGDMWESTPFAILYSNTETLQPALYNSRPIPVVDRRFKDADPVGKLGSEVSTRILKFLIEAESVDYDNFDEIIQPAVLDVLVVNRGLSRFKYVADTSNDQVKGECVYGETVRWDKFFHGYAKTWKKVPWIGFEWDMTKDEIEKNFPDVNKDDINFDDMQDTADENTVDAGESKEQLSGVELAKVYEVWDKKTRKVYFFSACCKGKPLKELDDPLGLSNFFPVPKPLNLMKKVTSLIPTPLYVQYKQQAAELNNLTRRLKHIIEALKVRGMYDSTIEGIEKLLTAEENEMIPAENRASMPEGMGMDKMLWMLPLAELSTTAQNLYSQREQVKQVIYEITGISDILRGASVASETATAQNIKNQWGTLRLKKMQKEVMRYCRDCLRIMLEIAVTRFDQATIQAMTGLNYPTDQMKQQAQQQIATIQQQAQMAAQQQQMMPADPNQPPPPPPAPPQIPPELQQVVNSPTWEDILGLLKNDTLRSYRVDIETNSTIDAEASQDKQDISELLNALSQFLNGVAPLIENGTMPFEVAKIMMLSIARRFTFGPQLEEALQQMKPPPPPPEAQPDPSDQIKLETAKIKGQADQAKAQLEMQRDQQQAQMDQAEFANKQQLAQMQMALDQKKLEIAQAELMIAEEQMNLDREMMHLKAQFAIQQHGQKMEAMKMKAQTDKAAANNKAKTDATV